MENYENTPNTNVNDESSVGLNILSFLFPIVGFILFFAMKAKTPYKAKACGKWGLIGFGVSLVLNIILSL